MKQMAALVWYCGVVVLIIKSSSLFLDAKRVGAEQPWIALAVISGVVLGWIKAKCLFEKVCVKNLRRIEALKQPKLWQFYRVRFFIFLALMILLGASLSRLAQGNYLFLIAIAVVELSVAIALFISSFCFWRD